MFTRDFAAPTLEDHFNKTVLPKVMQVCCYSNILEASIPLLYNLLYFLYEYIFLYEYSLI